MLFIYKLFERSIKWNAFESIFYQSALTIHQIIIFYFCDRAILGINGILFAFIYLSITFLNLGFDKSIAPFLTTYTKNKNNFNKLFVSQFVIQILILLITAFCLVNFNQYVLKIFKTLFSYDQIDLNLFIIITGIIFLEGSKKTLKTIIQLEFLNKESAFIEIFSISLYLAIFWIGFIFKQEITLKHIFIPLVIESLISNLFYLYFLIKIYKKVSSKLVEDVDYKSISKRIISIRLSNYINQISHLFFSSNFLLLFFGYLYGYKQSAIIKLSSSLSVFFSTIISKSFGFTSEALLGHLKDFSLNVKIQALEVATKKLFTTLICLFIFFLTNYKLFYKFSPEIIWLEAYSFLFFLLFENFFITYELFFLIQEKFYYVAMINLCSALFFYLIIFKLKTSLIITIIFLYLIRIISFFLLRIVSKYKFRVNLPYKINLKYIISFSLVSIIFSFLVS